MYHNHMLSI